MDSRRQPEKTDAEATSKPATEAKPQTPMQEAIKLQAAIEKINKREADYIGNAKLRYQKERDALLAVASDKAKRILEEAGRE